MKLWDEIKAKSEGTAIGQAIQILDDIWNSNRRLFLIDIVATMLLSTYVSGLFIGLTMKMNKEIHELQWWKAIFIGAGGYNKSGYILSILLFIVLNFYIIKMAVLLNKGYTIEKERKIKVSKYGEMGSNRLMEEDEAKRTFKRGNILRIRGNIAGIQKNGEIYEKIRVSNGNAVVFGVPGAGKSVSYVIPIIMQTIRRGESLIVTDPKRELYEITAGMAKAHGYEVKVFNVNPDFIIHSDSCNFMSMINGDTTKAMSFAQTIIDNTSNGKKDTGDFWSESEKNLLCAVILLANKNNMGYESNLKTVHDIITQNTPDSLEAIFATLPPNHPAIRPFNIYKNGDKTVKGNTLSGLGIRLSFLNDSIVRELVSTDDISFTAPGDHKCIYYVGCSDQDTSMSVLMALFFTVMYQSLVPFADSQPDRMLPVKVTMLLDEFKNIGKIPSFPEKLSTVRSRGIDSIMILQGLEQLQIMYPDNEWETIMNDCEMHILLKTNSQLTAEYFSIRSGTMTAVTTSKRTTEQALDILRLHPEFMENEQKSERRVLTQGEVLTMGDNTADDIRTILVAPADHNVIQLNSFYYKKHPMYQEIHEIKIEDHYGKWLRDMNEGTRQMLGIEVDLSREEYDCSQIDVVPESEYLMYNMSLYNKQLKKAYEKMDLPRGRDGKKIEIKFACRQQYVNQERKRQQKRMQQLDNANANFNRLTAEETPTKGKDKQQKQVVINIPNFMTPMEHVNTHPKTEDNDLADEDYENWDSGL